MKLKLSIIVILLILALIGLTRCALEEQFFSEQAVSEQLFVVYFPSSDKTILLPEYRVGKLHVENILQALVDGPTSSNLSSPLPRGTEIINYHQKGNLITVNFSKEFITNHPGGSMGELITIYSIVNSLTEHPSIEKVQLIVGNQKIDTLAGHVDLLNPISEDRSLIENENL